MISCLRLVRHSSAFKTVIGNESAMHEIEIRLPVLMQLNGLRTSPFTAPVKHAQVQQEVMQDASEIHNEKFTKNVLDKVNHQILNNQCGRLFAVVYFAGKQKLVTPEDLVMVEGVFPPNIGDKIRLEKVMCVGGLHFTLYGRPLLSRDLVNVEATVVEKNLSHCRVYFRSLRRQNNRKTKFSREMQTLLRINCVDIMHKIGEIREVEGADGRIF
ncbi:39S ribosomal protein L21, mitochondrial [Halocaridina rubra]|uniref:Large ribosomal subunit protein bL21m n=1 Tax=Halocaridina rubra TaxID=373956 RepID=A0AAN8ZW17_HALRR